MLASELQLPHCPQVVGRSPGHTSVEFTLLDKTNKSFNFYPNYHQMFSRNVSPDEKGRHGLVPGHLDVLATGIGRRRRRCHFRIANLLTKKSLSFIYNLLRQLSFTESSWTVSTLVGFQVQHFCWPYIAKANEILTLNSFLNFPSKRLRIRMAAQMPSVSTRRFSNICISADWQQMSSIPFKLKIHPSFILYKQFQLVFTQTFATNLGAPFDLYEGEFLQLQTRRVSLDEKKAG